MTSEKLARSVPRTVLPQNEVQLNDLARRLRRLRKYKKGSDVELSNVYIDEYNARQCLPAKETRSKHQSGLTSAEQAAYAGGLTDEEWWAFQAYAMDVDCTHQLTMTVFREAVKLAQEQDWTYNYNSQHPQVLCLARLVIDEWLHPSKYEYSKKKGPVESASAFARTMHMDRSTWHTHWRNRWLALKHIPRDWYLHATHTIDANYSGSLRTFTAPGKGRAR